MPLPPGRTNDRHAAPFEGLADQVWAQVQSYRAPLNLKISALQAVLNRLRHDLHNRPDEPKVCSQSNSHEGVYRNG